MKAVFIVLYAGMVACASAQSGRAAGAAKYTETVLHSFGSGTDGQDPCAGLIDVKGMLYGTTCAGGAYGYGSVFSLDARTGAETVLYSFCSQANCADGASPQASVIDVKGILYGTTTLGGNADAYCPELGCGIVFSLDPNTGVERVLYAFCGQARCADGSNPYASLIDVKDRLYGTTSGGGSTISGTLFSVDPKTGTENVAFSFCTQSACADGEFPGASVIDVKGIFYGTAEGGGTGVGEYCDGCGTVFAYNPKNGTHRALYSFCTLENCADGQQPTASMTDVNGTMYSTTLSGGNYSCSPLDYGCGTAFSLDPNSGAENVLLSLHGSYGTAPVGGMINVNGGLYGMTNAGGVNGGGTVFAINLKTGDATVVYSFCAQSNCSDGAYPQAGLLTVNGAIYGTTAAGGANGAGTVFEIKER
jgi:uncharacterized repeat protein (TIGR03803 family)